MFNAVRVRVISDDSWKESKGTFYELFEAGAYDKIAIQEQALQGSPKALTNCLSRLNKDVASNPGQRPPIVAEFVSWGLFSAIFSIERAPPDTPVDVAFWCQHLHLSPVHLALQIILAGAEVPAEGDKELHTDVWPGVLRWIIFISRLDDDACQSMDPSVLKLAAEVAKGVLQFLARPPQGYILYKDFEGAHCLFLSTVRLAFCCPAALWSASDRDMFSSSYFILAPLSKKSHRLSPELASQIAGLSVMAISQQVEDRTEHDTVFLDRFVLLRLLVANDKALVRQLSAKRYAHWLMAWAGYKARPTLPFTIFAHSVAMINHILFFFQQMILWGGTPVATEILASGFLGVVSSDGYTRLMEFDALHGERDADYDMIGIKDHTRKILQSMQTFSVLQSFIREIKSPVAAFKRSRTYKENLQSQDVQAFLEVVALRRRMRQDYIRRCGNDTVR